MFGVVSFAAAKLLVLTAYKVHILLAQLNMTCTKKLVLCATSRCVQQLAALTGVFM